MSSSNRYLYANQLRGVAALLVLASHWFGVYWGMREVVARYTASAIQDGANPLAYQIVSFNPEFGWGPFGVSIFFLISGFVIPFSLEKNTRPGFLIARLFRIFPTYWVGLLISLGLVWCSSLYWGKPLPWDAKAVFFNAFLCNDLMNIASVDLVNWTLAIEIKFYLLAALFSPAICKGKSSVLFLWSALALLINWNLKTIVTAFANPSVAVILGACADSLVYIQFMLIGVFFYHASRGKIPSWRLFAYSFTQLAMFALTWKHSRLVDQYPVVPLIYFYGFCVFALSFVARNHFKANKVFDWFAAISYPLYVIHSLCGYVLIRILLDKGLSFNMAAILAFTAVAAVTYALHRLVELPSTALGKSLASRSSGLVNGLLRT
jgi:peptidoglycan/LPS O-acetylase OafA/YrhL